MAWLFFLLRVSLEEQIFKNFDEVQFVNLLLVDYAFGNISKIPLPNTRSQRFSPLFTSRIITTLGLTFRPIIHFKLILYTVRYSMDQCILFFVFVYTYSTVPASVIERTILFPWNYFHLCQKSIVPIHVSLCLDFYPFNRSICLS